MALARALYGDPVLVVLDEPDANLDTDGELALAETLRLLLRRGVTTLMVTHNLRLLRAMEYVLVLKDGVLVEARPTPGGIAALPAPCGNGKTEDGSQGSAKKANVNRPVDATPSF